jgi:hypothetical protein
VRKLQQTQKLDKQHKQEAPKDSQQPLKLVLEVMFLKIKAILIVVVKKKLYQMKNITHTIMKMREILK